MLFFKKKNTNKLQKRQFVLSNNFRGFKRFPIIIHGNNESEKNNELLKDTDLKGHIIIFKPGSSTSYKEPFYVVFLDNLQIGAIFDKKQIKAIQQDLFSAVYAKPEEETIISKEKTEKRHRIKLFVKYEGNHD